VPYTVGPVVGVMWGEQFWAQFREWPSKKTGAFIMLMAAYLVAKCVIVDLRSDFGRRADGAILTLSASVTGGVNARGAFLGLVYALGLGLPFIALAVGVGRMSRTLSVLRRHGHRLQVIGGGLLIVVGLAIATGLWQRWMIALRPLIQGVELPI